MKNILLEIENEFRELDELLGDADSAIKAANEYEEKYYYGGNE